MLIYQHTTSEWRGAHLIAKLCCLVFALFIPPLGQSQPTQVQESPAVCRDQYYQAAFEEIASMLDGKAPLSIKRAVFLAEWAYFEGNLDYDEYCRTIDDAVTFLNKFINANGLEKYKTAKNMALIEYFFNPWSGNGNKPFTYDFNETVDKRDFSYQFVTKVMRTHTGQCRSLPYYYKILAEAIGAEAYIAYAPVHTFIRYRDEDNLFPEDWVNVELTTHQLAPEFHYIEAFEINEAALKNKVYLQPLTDRETVASQLSDLAFAYSLKYQTYDDFTYRCTNKSLNYYPQNYNSYIIMGKTLQRALDWHLQHYGGVMDEYAQFLERQSSELYDRLLELGWEQLGAEYFDRLDRKNEEAQRIIKETGGIKL
ncbi:hypothetical protein [uncultured Alistipes sp.]|jgi:hypothetical protein|uniref:hypothetical protein n=1 Tax=uncultured Alistipes sp. TaxID=538949 RepID=UPI0025E43442|nr:hypothetical protein [uncultured Alistipes sp.]